MRGGSPESPGLTNRWVTRPEDQPGAYPNFAMHNRILFRNQLHVHVRSELPVYLEDSGFIQRATTKATKCGKELSNFLNRADACARFLSDVMWKWNQHCALRTRSLLALSRFRTSDATLSSDCPVHTQASTYDGKRSNSSWQSRMIGTFGQNARRFLAASRLGCSPVW